MFPITCNAFGDIIAVAQLIRDIATALDEVRGATSGYRAFVQQLHTTATIIDEAHRLVHGRPASSLQAAILDEVRGCCADLERAEERTSGFEAFLPSNGSQAPGSYKLRDRLSRGAKMLQWRFQRSPETKDLSQALHNRCLRIQTLLTLLNG